MSNEKELLNKVLPKMLGITADELTSLVYQKEGEEITLIDDADKLILEKNAAKIKSIKDEKQEYFDNGYKKAQKESLTKLEKDFKERTGYDADAEGLDLFIGYAESVKGKTPTEPTEDQIKKSSFFVQQERKWKEEAEEAVKEVKTEFEDFKSNVDKTQTLSKYKNKAWDFVIKKKPNLEDGRIGENRKRAFLRELDQYDFKDDLIIQGDKRVEDEQGNPLTFDQLVDNLSHEYFTFQKQDPKGNAGNKGGSGGAEGDVTIKSKEHFHELMKEHEGNSEMIVKISKAWREFQGN